MSGLNFDTKFLSTMGIRLTGINLPIFIFVSSITWLIRLLSILQKFKKVFALWAAPNAIIFFPLFFSFFKNSRDYFFIKEISF